MPKTDKEIMDELMKIYLEDLRVNFQCEELIVNDSDMLILALCDAIEYTRAKNYLGIYANK